MPRYRQSERRWIHAACIAGAYLVLVAGLFTLQLGVGLSLPVSVAMAAPPLVYAALAMLLLREAMPVRRLSWIGSACVIHLMLSTLAAIELTLAGGLSFGAALAQVFVLFPPGPVLTLVATPLTLAAFGLTTSNPARRPEASPRPAPPASARPKPVPAPVRAGKSAPEAAAPGAPAPRVATPQVSAAAPPVAAALRPPLSATAAAPAPVARVAPAASPVVAAVAAAPAPAAASWPPKPVRRADEMVRVSFARIAAQLPAEAFVLPFERLSESLREPHVLLVPRRVVLSQMRGGAVAISWGHIASQFPDLALGMSDDEFRNQYPDLKLWLPMDEVTPQLPPPEPVRVEPAPAPAPPPTNGPTTLPVAPTPPSSPVIASAPVAPTPPSSPVIASVVAPPAVRLVDADVLNRIVGCFSGVGSFESAAERIGGTTVVSLVEPGVPREAVTACAGHLLRCLAGASAEIVTVRTRRAAVVLAVAPTPIVVAARLPGAPVALLGIRALRAAAGVVDGTLSLSSPPTRALEPVSVDGRMAQAAQALRSFGAVDSTVFADGAAHVYVFSAGGGDDKALGALALNVCDALGDGGDLGRPRAIVFRRGGDHTFVRPLAGSAGVLVATGSVTRPGRLLGEADRAATVLEAV
jgi:hypothetical protein